MPEQSEATVKTVSLRPPRLSLRRHLADFLDANFRSTCANPQGLTPYEFSATLDNRAQTIPSSSQSIKCGTKHLWHCSAMPLKISSINLK